MYRHIFETQIARSKMRWTRQHSGHFHHFLGVRALVDRLGVVFLGSPSGVCCLPFPPALFTPVVRFLGLGSNALVSSFLRFLFLGVAGFGVRPLSALSCPFSSSSTSSIWAFSPLCFVRWAVSRYNLSISIVDAICVTNLFASSRQISGADATKLSPFLLGAVRELW